MADAIYQPNMSQNNADVWGNMKSGDTHLLMEQPLMVAQGCPESLGKVVGSQGEKEEGAGAAGS